MLLNVINYIQHQQQCKTNDANANDANPFPLSKALDGSDLKLYTENGNTLRKFFEISLICL